MRSKPVITFIGYLFQLFCAKCIFRYSLWCVSFEWCECFICIIICVLIICVREHRQSEGPKVYFNHFFCKGYKLLCLIFLPCGSVIFSGAFSFFFWTTSTSESRSLMSSLGFLKKISILGKIEFLFFLLKSSSASGNY